MINHPDGNQFVARVWRTTQKSEITTQKDELTTQKSEVTTQKNITATQKEILNYLKEHPQASRQETAAAMGEITEDGVKFNIGKLQQYGLLKREGGRKHGMWVVLNTY